MSKIKMMSRFTGGLSVLSILIFCGLFQTGCSKYAVPMKAPLPEAPPPPDTARVYFINPGAPTGDAATYILKETHLISYLESKNVTYVDLPAGEHFFMSVASNPEGIYAKLAGGRTYYIRLIFEAGPETPIGGKTVNAFLDPIVPGDEGWENRREWIERAQLVALNKDRAKGWNSRWSARNEKWFQQFKNGEKRYTSLDPDQGE
jgi:hypothetical protein